MMETKVTRRKTIRLSVRVSPELDDALQQAAQQSGWTKSEQARYELEHPRGLWKDLHPYLPGQNRTSQNIR